MALILQQIFQRMKDKLLKNLKFFRSKTEGALSFFALTIILAQPLCALADGVNQNTAYLNTDTQNRSASDNSLQHSTAYGMRALMDLGNLNIKSAVNNGMNAYGKYRNSETLDKLGDINFNQANAMASAGSSSAAPRKTDTTFRRLDPKFLHQGEFAKVATEFEKKSGMRRETFLNQLSEVSEKKISRRDPQLVDKVLGRFESFISKIPNKDFRNNLQKGVNMVPDSMRTGIISKAVAKFSNAMVATGGPAPAAAPMNVEAVAEKPEMFTGEAPSAATEESESIHPSAQSPMLPERELASEGEESANPLGNIIQAAIDTQAQEPTIFQLVTRRYRILTPQIAGR